MGSIYKRPDSSKYYGDYANEFGKRSRRCTGTSNKADARRIVEKWETEANLLKHGILERSVGTLEDLLDEFIVYLGNTSPQHRVQTEQRVRRVCNANDWTKPEHINQLQLENTVRSFKRLGTKSESPISLRSQSHYITACKMFSNWLCKLA